MRSITLISIGFLCVLNGCNTPSEDLAFAPTIAQDIVELFRGYELVKKGMSTEAVVNILGDNFDSDDGPGNTLIFSYSWGIKIFFDVDDLKVISKRRSTNIEHTRVIRKEPDGTIQTFEVDIRKILKMDTFDNDIKIQPEDIIIKPIIDYVY